MIIAALSCLIIAVVALAVGQVFIKNKTLSTLFFVLILLILVSLGLVCASYNNDFGGYSIFLILSPLPLLLESFTVEENEEKVSSEETESEDFQEQENEENAQISENSQKNEKKKKKKKIDSDTFAERLTLVVQGVGCLLSSVCIFFCALHLGKESLLGALAGIAFGFVLTFLFMALKKEHSLSAFLARIFPCVSAGICLGGVLCALLYSFSLSNILFSLGALLLGVYLGKFIQKKNISNLVLVAAYAILFVTLII